MTATDYLISIVPLLVFIALFVLALFDKSKFTTRSITYGAICIALGFILSYIKLFTMPQKGSVTLASMFPIMLYAYIFGPKKGMLIGIIYGMLQWMQDGFYTVHAIQVLLDYPVAFGFLGIAGFAKFIPNIQLSSSKAEKMKEQLLSADIDTTIDNQPEKKSSKFKQTLRNNFNDFPIGFAVGMIFACIARYCSHSFGGVVFFKEYAELQNVWVYSLGYNTYVLAECVICIFAGALLFANKNFRNILFQLGQK